MEFRDYLRIVRRRWRPIVALIILAIAIAYVTAPAPRRHGAPPAGTTYTAAVTLMQAPDAGAFSTQSLATTALLVNHGEVPRRAAAQLHFPGDPAILAGQVAATYDATVGSVSITASGTNPTAVVNVANGFSAALLGYLGDRAAANKQRDVDQLEATLSAESAQIHTLDGQIAASTGTQKDLYQAERDAVVEQYGRTFGQLNVTQGQNTLPSLVTLDSATAVPHTTTSIIRTPSTKVGRISTAVFLALVVGVGAALGVELLGNKVGSRDSTEELLDLPVIADIPYLPVWQRRTREPVVVTHPSSPAAEAYRLVAASLYAMRRPGAVASTNGANGAPANGLGEHTSARGPRVVLVTSAGAGDGKTSTAVNVAASLAHAGRSTLLIDTDFRRPSAHQAFGLDNFAGLSDLLQDHLLRLADYVRATNCPRLSLLPAGPLLENRLALLHGLPEVIEEARKLADVVVVDTSPLLHGSEVIDLVSEVDAVLLVCRPGRTSRERARLATELLDRFGAPVLGTVLIGERTGVHLPIGSPYRYGAYGAQTRSAAVPAVRGNGHHPAHTAAPSSSRPGTPPPSKPAPPPARSQPAVRAAAPEAGRSGPPGKVDGE